MSDDSGQKSPPSSGVNGLFRSIDDVMEKKSQLSFLSTIYINPAGYFHLLWDIITLLFVIFSSFWEPVNVAFYSDRDKGGIASVEALTDAVFWLDILINFNTAYDTGYKIETNKYLIAKQYIMGWFFLDLISTIAWVDLVGFGELPDPNSPDYQSELNIRQAVSLLGLLKVFRLLRISRLKARLTMNLTTHSSFIEAYTFFFYVVIVAHLLACFFYLVPKLDADTYADSWRANSVEGFDDFPLSHQYLVVLYFAFTTMTTIGYGDISPTAMVGTLFTIAFEVVGLAFFAILLTQFNNVYQASRMEESKHNKYKDDIIGFIKNASMTPPQKHLLVGKVREYLRFKRKSHYHTFTNDDPRFDCLSYAIKDEIRRHIFLPALSSIKMFGPDTDRAMIQAMDTDEVKGWIDDDEILEALRGFGEQNVTVSDVKEIMESIGSNKEGMVSIDKFYEWFHMQRYKLPSLIHPLPFVEMLASRVTAMAFSPDDTLVTKGEYGENMFIMLTGTVEVRMRNYLDTVQNATKKMKKALQRLTIGLKDGSIGPGGSMGPGDDRESLSVGMGANSNIAKMRRITLANVSLATHSQKGSDTYVSKMVEATDAANEPSPFPVFGVIAALPSRDYQIMRDRTRRWEVRVVKERKLCADVCFVNRTDLLQIFEATWDEGQNKYKEFCDHYYNVDLNSKNTLGLRTKEYEMRAKIQRLESSLNAEMSEGLPAPPAGSGSEKMADMKQQIGSITRLVTLSTQLTAARMNRLEEKIKSVRNQHGSR